ncbi:MAG: hypothetical protein R2684_14300 [Pyrinomonadaceae bacterium]
MNSEELEQSLRAEFENYLKDVVAGMRQDVNDFQEKFKKDFEAQKSELERTFEEFAGKLDEPKELEASFADSVAEHLKLARDEGASITAAAIAEAEKLEEEAGPSFEELRDALDDISSKDSQSEILKALVGHASDFTPRGAFFIVKNEHLVGWRVFGREQHEDPKVVREVFFPVSTKTALGSAVESLQTIDSIAADSEDDLMYRDRLGFKDPERMHAIPLLARGRGVAVLYADSGAENGPINLAGLEILMKVAGLTVEVLASAPHVARPKTESDSPVREDHEEMAHEGEASVEDHHEDFAPVAAPVVDASSFVDSEPEAAHQDVASFEPVAEEPVAVSDEVPYEVESSLEEPAIASDFESSLEEPAAPEEDYSFSDYSSAVADDDYSYGDADDSVDYSYDSAETVSETESFEAPSYEDPVADEYSFKAETSEPASDYSFEASEPASKYSLDSYSDSDSYSYDADSAADTTEVETEEGYSVESDASDYDFESTADVSSDSDYSFGSSDVESEPASEYSFAESEPEVDYSYSAPAEDAAPTYTETVETESFDAAPVEAPVEIPSMEAAPVVESVQTAEPAPAVRSRFADRNLDLPIEVADDERRLHNDARRFARLLVSEIKLYNEQKVKEGRESSDLYERLREAIDRSREMYDKRVQPPVAAKFDYFNYELINTLAEGDDSKLGASYPGPAV